jgi:GAF domain-containing protein
MAQTAKDAAARKVRKDGSLTRAEREARIATLEAENARLLGNLRERTHDFEEALEYQTAISGMLKVINRSTFNLQPVLDTLVETAARLCMADVGYLAIRQGDAFRYVATVAADPAWDETVRAMTFHPGRGTIAGRAVASGQVVQVADLAADSEYALPQAVTLGGLRTTIGVPMLREGQPNGVITLARRRVEPFTDRQIELVRTFADQAVIAMENARLLAETRVAFEQQSAAAEVLGVIISSPGELQPVLKAVAENAVRLCDADKSFIFRFDGELLRAEAACNASAELTEFVAQNPIRPGRYSGTARCALERQTIHIPDAVADPEYTYGATQIDPIRTVLCVPMLKGGELLGVITVYHLEVRPFSDTQIALIETFANQAALAIENTRLLTETREALERQTAVAEVLGIINSSPGDLAPLFDAMLEKAMRLCGAAFGGLFFCDGERARTAATRGISQELDDFVRRGFVYSRGLGRGEGITHIADLSQAPASEIIAAATELGGARTMLNVALRKDGRLVGFFSVFRQEVRPFTDKQIALLQNFSAQAVIAMENARLFNELRERTRDLQQSLDYQTATSDVLKVISRSAFDLQPVLETVAETAARLCASEIVTILRRHHDGYHVAAARGWSPEYKEFLQNHTFAADDRGTLTGRVALDCHAVQVEDITADPKYVLSEAATLGKARTQLGVPLLREGLPIGVIIASRQRVEPFTQKQIELVTTFADQAVIAMENARLLGELRQRTEEVTELNRGLEARVAEQVEELGRIGRLKRFLAPQLAELIVSQGDEKILESHRREIVVVFCDLRGYTAFTETAEPEEVLDFLREYHGALGPLVTEYEGTLDQFSGDGIMVFFNDPIPIPDPAERAVKMAAAMREAAGELIASWRRRRGRVLGFGVGIAQGYATLGQIGFADRSGYTAIGTVCNLAARLCAEAKDGQILLAQRVAVAVEEAIPVEDVGELTLKGLSQPVVAYNVPLAATQPALRVIEGGPPSV